MVMVLKEDFLPQAFIEHLSQVTELGQKSEHLAVETWLIEQHVQR